jgi:hypothetical protein
LVDLSDRRLIDPGGIMERPGQGSPLPPDPARREDIIRDDDIRDDVAPDEERPGGAAAGG